MGIVEKVKKALNQNRLVGNTVFDDKEFDELLGITRNTSKDYLNRYSDLAMRRELEIIFITLLEITKRWKKISDDENDESGFWDHVIGTILGLERGSTNFNKLYKAYTNIIELTGCKHQIIIAEEGNKFYRTLMLHALSPIKSMYAFLDLCYNIYKKDLNFNYTQNDKSVCELITIRFCEILLKSVGNDKSISIGTNSYSVKIGLRTLALQNETQNDFVILLDEALRNINTLFYDQVIKKESYFENLVDSWWQDKQAEIGIDKTGSSRLTPAVRKDKITVKFIRYDDDVYLVIPPIRIDNINTSSFFLSIAVGDNNIPIIAEELFTKRGEFIDTTKQKDVKLNELLHEKNSIKVRIEISENGNVLFKKIIEKDFILFENQNEVSSNINQTSNYFLYIKDISKLLTKPEEIKQISSNLYNIYPKAGESLTSNERQVLFHDGVGDAKSKNIIQFIGGLSSCVYQFENKTYTIFNDDFIILIPNETSIKGLEFRYNDRKILLSELKTMYTEHENQIEESYKLFSIIKYLPQNEPLEVLLYSHLEEKAIFKMSIIYFPTFKINFLKKVYYGDDEKSVTVSYNENSDVLNWNNRQNELNYQFLNGELIITIPCIKWRIDNKGWRNEPYGNKIWYKDEFHNGSILDIVSNSNIDIIINENDPHHGMIKRNKNGFFEIGNYIFSTDNKRDLKFTFLAEDGNYKKLFTVSKQEHFYKKPLVISDNKLIWQANNSYVGDMKRQFRLEVFDSDNKPVYFGDLSLQENEIIEINDGIYRYRVSSEGNNLFKKTYEIFYDDEIIIGSIEKYLYTNKYIQLTSAILCYIEEDDNNDYLNRFNPQYFIDRIEYIDGDNQGYYTGYLFTYNKEGRKIYLNTMENEKNVRETINPLRIEFPTANTLSIIAGYNKKDPDDFLGELIYDLSRHSICNVNASIKNKRYRIISSYRFIEVKNV